MRTNQIWHGKHENPKQFSSSHGFHTTDQFWSNLEMTDLHCFSFLFKTNYFSLLPADHKAWELELTVTKVILQLEKLKDGKNLALQKVNKISWGLNIAFVDFYFMEGFRDGESAWGHCFYSLCKLHCLMSSPSCSLTHFTFRFTRNINKEEEKLSYRTRVLQSSLVIVSVTFFRNV